MLDTDPASGTVNTVVATITVGLNPKGVAVNPAGTRVYTTSSLGSVSVIDITQGFGAVLAPITVGAGPTGVAVNPAGTRLYVTNANANTVSVINIAGDANSVIGTITVGAFPGGVAVNADGTRVYVANGGGPTNTVSVIDTTQGGFGVVIATIAVGASAFGVATAVF